MGFWKNGNGLRAWHLLRRYFHDRRGSIATITVLLIVPLTAILGLATESGTWYLIQRSEQNAADSAVLAAAQNGIINTSGTTYINEGKQVALNFGYAASEVTPVNGQTCPAPYSGSGCYKVTISRSVQVNLPRLVGYRGTNGSGSQTVIATAMAASIDYPVSTCITSLGTGSIVYRIDGGNNLALHGCSVAVAGDAKCAGSQSSGGATYFFVAGSNQNCSPQGGTGPVTDPYTSTYPWSNIPGGNNACGSNAANYFPNPITGPVDVTAAHYCGDVTLTGDVNATNGGVMVIENGSLNLNGHTFTGTGLTIVFTGQTVSGLSPSHAPPTNGTIDVSAPTSGNWSGVAIYQDPRLTTGVDWSSAGNGLHWNITGLIYMPNSNLLFSGSVNKATGGNDCFTLVDLSFRLNGSADIGEQQTGCTSAGLNPPTNNIKRAILVQ
jgi:Flp pilus assembly protein TadG